MNWPLNNLTNAFYIWGFIFNFLFAILLFRLRSLAESHSLTKSQRWALTMAAWLYLANSGQIFFEVLMNLGETSFSPITWLYISHMRSQFNLFATLFLLCMGLVYPTLLMRWKRLKFLLAVLAILWVPLIIILFRYEFTMISTIMGGGIHLLALTYLPACFIPIFLWLPVYWKHNSPQLDNTLTILIWGYLFVFVVGQVGSFIVSVYFDTPSRWMAIEMILIAVTLLLISKTIYHKRGQWGTAEKMNIVLITGSLGLAVIWGVVMIRHGDKIMQDSAAWLQFVWFLCGVSGWVILRPLLFSYGLLRYQFFGPKVNVSRYFELIMAVVSSSLAGLLTMWFVGQFSRILAVAAGLAVFFVLLYPALKLFKLFVIRSLPMSAGSAKAPLAERRATYLMGLQTAVVEGEIMDPVDKESLEQLRLDLNVSQREHDLLMDGFLRDRPQTMQDQLEEAYLFHKNGMLLGFVSRESGQGEGKEGMMAAMLSTVGKFAGDALKKGSDTVESIEYGNITLIVETEGDIALGVLLSGKDNPQVRQRMRDILGSINKGYGTTIQEVLKQDTFEQMEKAKERLKGLEGLMRRFLREGGG